MVWLHIITLKAKGKHLIFIIITFIWVIARSQ